MHERLFDQALRANNSLVKLSEVVRQLLRDPQNSISSLLEELESFRKELKRLGRESDEDVVLEVMDFLTGWASPPMKIRAHPNGGSGGKTGNGAIKVGHSFPPLRLKVIRPGTSGGIWTDRPEAVRLRDLYFPPTAVAQPTVAILDLTGMFPTPGVLEDFVLPIAQGIRGGIYGDLILVVRTHDPAIANYFEYLGEARNLTLIVAPSLAQSTRAHPVGDLTRTDEETLTLIIGMGGTITAAELAGQIGIEPTAAGNRLVNLARKHVIYQFTQPSREGNVYVDPRSLGLTAIGTTR